MPLKFNVESQNFQVRSILCHKGCPFWVMFHVSCSSPWERSFIVKSICLFWLILLGPHATGRSLAMPWQKMGPPLPRRRSWGVGVVSRCIDTMSFFCVWNLETLEEFFSQDEFWGWFLWLWRIPFFAQNGHWTCDILKGYHYLQLPSTSMLQETTQTRGIALSWQSCDRDLCWGPLLGLYHFKGWNGDLLSGIFTGHIESPGFRTDSPQQIGFPGKWRASIQLKVTHAIEIWKIFMNQTNLHDFGFNIWIFQVCFQWKLDPSPNLCGPVPWTLRNRGIVPIEGSNAMELQRFLSVNGERRWMVKGLIKGNQWLIVP